MTWDAADALSETPDTDRGVSTLTDTPEAELAAGTPARPWQPVDLTTVLDGAWEPPQAAVGRRSDGVGLFYPGKTHTVASESEAGKTWFALSACIDELTAGRHVLYLDFEDDEGTLVRRLLALQIPPDLILSNFHYLKPHEALGTGIHLDDLRRVLGEFTSRPSGGCFRGPSLLQVRRSSVWTTS